LPELEALVEECNSDWVYEDGVYRFYHQSFKVYLLQESALRIVEKLRALAPDREFNEWFAQILTDGTGKTFAIDAKRLGFVALFVQSQMKFVSASRRNQQAGSLCYPANENASTE
jgi:hypothetical protein